LVEVVLAVGIICAIANAICTHNVNIPVTQHEISELLGTSVINNPLHGHKINIAELTTRYFV